MSDINVITDLEELTLYIQERIQEYDSAIDTSSGSSFYTTVILPLLTRLGPDPYNTPIRTFILNRLATAFPDMVLQDGEPLDDLLVKPLQILLEPFRRQIQQVSVNQSLADPGNLNEREADNLCANYFGKRRAGGTSVGIARLYFTAPQGATVTPNNAVYDGSGHRFFPVENQAISSSNMLFNSEDNLFYFDIIVRAEQEGLDYNIEPNSLTGIEELPSVVKVKNRYKFEEGADKENTAAYITRVSNSLTEKSLVTFRGINARLLEVFENIRLVQAIGYGDPEMNRDIVTGESARPLPFVYFLGDTGAGGPTITLTNPTNSILAHDGTLEDTFFEAELLVGDHVVYMDVSTGVVSEHTVTAVSLQTIQVSPSIAGGITGGSFSVSRARASITLSGIPGGILQPTTPAGEIQINSGEIHIGGMVDVFVRAGAPIQREVAFEGVLDGSPLHFGVDLETFGEREDEFVHVTPRIEDQALRPSIDRFGNGVTDHILICQYDDVTDPSDPYVPWKPTEEDVGRYIQILDGGGQALLEILDVLDEEYYSNGGTISPPVRVVRIQVSLTNEEDPSTPYTLGSNDAAFDTDFRVVEKVSIKNRVRDRDGTRLVYASPDVPSGSDLEVIGAEVGDSVVIENGDDAGIYTIREIFDWLDTGDTILLDRDLTKTVTPLGTGDGSGIRYRIADELNVSLVDPRITKIPLGSVFLGDDLVATAGSAQVGVSGTTNFLLAGVEEGDVLEILEGQSKGTYSIISVTGTTALLDSVLPSSGSPLDFLVYRSFTGIERPLVRVKEVELLDSSSQPTGITIPYGEAIDVRALGVFSNRAEGVQQESFTGESQVGTGTVNIRLYDAEVDFVAEGVVPGYRLNIFNTDNEGKYTVARVGTGDGLPSDNYIEVVAAADGGVEWSQLITGIHYTVGVASAGIARIYFHEPTSVEIVTGLPGGRLNYDNDGTPKEYFFSEVDGYRLLPAEGSGDEKSRYLRVVRNYETSTPNEFESILELTDPSVTQVFGLEIEVGDVLEVNEQIPFRNSGGETFQELGIFGKPAGLRTIAGSNRVSVPSNSLIDFTAMNSAYPLVGQALYIDEGPDAGEYVIEEVVSDKVLRLNTVMTTSTESIALQEAPGSSRDATLTPGVSTITMEDLTDSPGTQIGNFVTIFESTRGDIDGTFEVISIPGVSQAELDMDPGTYPQVDYVSGDIIPFATGLFSWVNTAGSVNVSHAFRIYKSVPTQAEVLQVATKRQDISLSGRGNVTTTVDFVDASATFVSSGVVAGDRLEILTGQNAGVYPIASVGSETALEIVGNPSKLFLVTGTNYPYRIWGGLYGSVKMLTVGKYESDDGQLAPGELVPFRLVRPGVFRVGATEMSESTDGSFYYVDVPVESSGSGDEFNLNRNDRLVVQSGMTADGYTYVVENNNLTFSPFEQVSLTFDRRFLPVGNSDSPENMTEVSGRNLKVTYETSTTAKLVHDLMRSDSERPINANPLGRHFLPSYVFTQITYRGGSSAADIGAVIEEYINNLGALDELEVSDIEAFATRRGASSVDHPIILATLTHDLDRKLVVNRTENRLGGSMDVPYNGTGRISCFFTTLGESLKVERES